MYKLDTQEVRRFTQPPETMGEITTFTQQIPIDIPPAEILVEEPGAVEMALGAVETLMAAEEKERVDHLEAKDISVTPEGLDLGEEK